MTIDEIEELESKKRDIPVVEADLVCAYGPGPVDVRGKNFKGKEEGDEEEFEDRLVDELCDKILKHFFGKNHEGAGRKGRKGLRKILQNALDAAADCHQDLSESLDMMEDGLFMCERMLAKHPGLIGTAFTDWLEEVSDHLEQWGMGHPADTDGLGKSQMD